VRREMREMNDQLVEANIIAEDSLGLLTARKISHCQEEFHRLVLSSEFRLIACSCALTSAQSLTAVTIWSGNLTRISGTKIPTTQPPIRDLNARQTI
jgi:hypothetical protein